MRTFLAMAAGLAMVSGSADGQVVIPPPEKPRELSQVVYMPPMPPESMWKPMARRNAERARVQQMQEEARRTEHVTLPELEYESLVVMDDAGKVERLKEWPDLAAVKRNPMLDERTKRVAMEVAAERRARLEQLVLDDLETLVKIDEGAIEGTNPFDREALRDLREMLRPFQTEGRLSNELQKRGVLTPVQARFNLTIAREYEEAVRKELLGDPPPVDKMLPYTMRMGISETLHTYDRMLATALRHAEVVAQEAGLGPKAAEQLASSGRGASGMSDADAAAKAREAMSDFSLEERRRVLEISRDILASEQD